MSNPVTDEQLQAIFSDVESYYGPLIAHIAAADDKLREFLLRDRGNRSAWSLHVLLQALRERDATIAELRYRVALRDGALNELRVIWNDQLAELPKLRTELTQWAETYARASAKLGEQEVIIEAQRRELAELREPSSDSLVSQLSGFLTVMASYPHISGDQGDKMRAAASQMLAMQRELAELRGNLEANQMTMRGMEQSKINLLEQIAELRKPVEDARSHPDQLKRRALRMEQLGHHGSIDVRLAAQAFSEVLSAYDTLAQNAAQVNRLLAYQRDRVERWEKQLGIALPSDGEFISDYIDGAQTSIVQLQAACSMHEQNAARDASARDALMAEIRGLRERADSATALVAQCHEYLKEGETPVQCIARNRADAILAMRQWTRALAERDTALDCLLQAQNAAIEVNKKLAAAEERERQLREALRQIQDRFPTGSRACEMARAALAQPQDADAFGVSESDSATVDALVRRRVGKLEVHRLAKVEQPKVDCHKCEGAGWLWGHELSKASQDTRNDTMTKYPCDGEAHEQEGGNG